VIRTGPPPAPQVTVLLTGVRRLQLAYWPSKQGDWISMWHDATPPRLVRIQIQSTDTGGRPWPDLLASPMLDPT
jgi:general secretion pathway protein J